ncbi:MAG TPA: Gx transporter family protein [Gammaproteobacteria bacterium]|nr:Gx transporter family protein [Gammaproteobacteria bacterium]
MRYAARAVTHEDRLVAGFTALAVAVHVLESAVPSPLPGVRPGLANVVTLLVLLRHGLRPAAWVALLRVIVSGLLLGTFLTPTFVLSLAGALASLVVLAASHMLARRFLGPVGYATLAALAHMAGQIAVAYAAFVPHPAVLALAPVLLTFALGLGIASGIICATILARLPERPA